MSKSKKEEIDDNQKMEYIVKAIDRTIRGLHPKFKDRSDIIAALGFMHGKSIELMLKAANAGEHEKIQYTEMMLQAVKDVMLGKKSETH